MLKKLLKHEIQATGRYMWIMYLVVVLLSVGGFVLTKVLCRDLLALEDKPIMIFILMFAMIIWFVALCAATLMTTVMNVYRFYKNFLSDEGYLMFTLPATVHELIWSKLLVAMLWSCITTLLVFLGISLGFGNLLAGLETAFQEEMPFALIFEELGLNVPLMIAITVLVSIIGSAVGPLEFYCVMSIGYGFNKNKALWSVVIYFALQTGLSIISGLFSVISMVANTERIISDAMFNMTFAQQWYLIMLGAAGVSLLLGAIFYLVTAWNLRKRLNLA